MCCISSSEKGSKQSLFSCKRDRNSQTPLWRHSALVETVVQATKHKSHWEERGRKLQCLESASENLEDADM